MGENHFWWSIAAQAFGLRFEPALLVRTVVRIVEIKQIAFVSEKLDCIPIAMRGASRPSGQALPDRTICRKFCAHVKEPWHRAVDRHILPSGIDQDNGTIAIHHPRRGWDGYRAVDCKKYCNACICASASFTGVRSTKLSTAPVRAPSSSTNGRIRRVKPHPGLGL